MVIFTVKFDPFSFEVLADGGHDLLQVFQNLFGKYSAPILAPRPNELEDYKRIAYLFESRLTLS